MANNKVTIMGISNFTAIKIKRRSKLLTLLLLMLFSTNIYLNIGGGKASALSGSQFNAGRIIDDAVFYNSDSMSVAQIQNFLDSKQPDCDENGSKPYTYHYRSSPIRLNDSRDPLVTTTRATYGQRVSQRDGSSWRGSTAPYTCLNNYSQNTVNIAPESGLCGGYVGANSESAATIIYKASKSCGINPQVMLVLLQKEQSLITDDWPWRLQYKKATGVDCPDNPPANWAPYNCKPESLGFFKQVYYGAHRYKWYKLNASNYQYRAGRNNNIYWHPSGGNYSNTSGVNDNRTGCGYSNVFIQNQATAALYIYTPYRPNQAALSNLYGEGNSCSSYGNRNFWRMFNDWFGSTQASFRLVECSGNKYLVESYIKTRRLLTDEAIEAWGLSSAIFNNGPDRACSYPAYALPLDRVARSRSSGFVYMFDSGRAFKLQSISIARAWGYESEFKSDLPQLNGNTLHMLKIVGSTPRLAKSANTHKVYLLNQGKIHHVVGTPYDTSNLSLIRGYGEVPMALFTGEYLSSIKTETGEGTGVGAGFRVNSNYYLFDHGKVRKIKPSYFPSRWEDLSAVGGPSLHPDVVNIMVEPASAFGPGFKRDGKYYFVGSNGNISESTSVSQARLWGVNTAPYVTNLLRSKLLN